MTRPDLEVWVMTGDGDAMSIGGNHFIHVLRRNVGVKVVMFNNRIYGLTKGQYSPTSEVGKRTKSSPMGVVDYPFNPLALAIGAGATFVARSVDIFQNHLKETLRRAAAHKGTAFVEVFQNCNIFNDKAFEDVTSKEGRTENAIYLEHGKPVIFGKSKDKGVRANGMDLEIVELGGSIAPENLLVWDETRENPSMAFAMAQLHGTAQPLGVLRAVDKPAYENGVIDQIRNAEQKRGTGRLEALIHSGDIWEVNGQSGGAA
jgi:2-oxoglutarate ferredoxin oxidoreductase subunit beta